MTLIVKNMNTAATLTEVKVESVPDLWHLSENLIEDGHPLAGKMVKDCWTVLHFLVAQLELAKRERKTEFEALFPNGEIDVY